MQGLLGMLVANLALTALRRTEKPCQCSAHMTLRGPHGANSLLVEESETKNGYGKSKWIKRLSWPYESR